MSTSFMLEPERRIPVFHEADLCVAGGSCTGVFAAVRAARLGARVVLLEKLNCFGGVATAGLVNIWHSRMDTAGQQVILAGLTEEVIQRLRPRRAVTKWKENQPDEGVRLNTEELKIELDQLVQEERIHVLLHTMCCDLIRAEDGAIEAVVVENKDGRGAIRARMFIDATGDGDLAARAQLPYSISPHLQPATTCAKIRGLEGINIRELYREHHAEYGLPPDTGWNGAIPNLHDVRMYAETHAFGMNCADAKQLTQAEMNERLKILMIMDMARKAHPEIEDRLSLLTLSSQIGIRETRRFEARYQLTEQDVLEGVRFEDAIANGSYRVDVHNPEGGGFLFKYLDGSQCAISANGREWGRWREERAVNPTFYQIPYRCMTHNACQNLIMAGRMICADSAAYGAIRVMVNLNQTGEAAGVAAWLALQTNCAAYDVMPDELRETLTNGGSVML